MSRFWEFPAGEAMAAENMAMDAAMLHTSGQRDCACWRVYGWREPALTFGYSQKWTWVQASTGRFTGAVVRRITGGGIVDHRNDLTYALSLPASHSLHRRTATVVYRELHTVILNLFQDAERPAALAPCPPGGHDPVSGTGICFNRPEPYDVIDSVSGAKLAGAAMKRTRNGLLIQGSITLDRLPGLDTGAFSQSLGTRVAGWLQLEHQAAPEAMDPEALASEQARFASVEWNQRR